MIVYIVMGGDCDGNWIEGAFWEKSKAEDCAVQKGKEYVTWGWCDVEEHEVS